MHEKIACIAISYKLVPQRVSLAEVRAKFKRPFDFIFCAQFVDFTA